jgi:hypothetical protein
MIDAAEASVSGRELAALGRGIMPSPMLVAAVTD